MDGILTLAERFRRQRDGMAAELPPLDAALAAYARVHGGRFVRFGSSARGAMRTTSDIDLIADFADERASIAACVAADALCAARGLVPDARPATWCSERLLARALAEGTLLA